MDLKTQDHLCKDGITVILALDAEEIDQYTVHWYIDKLHNPGDKLILVYCAELPLAVLKDPRQNLPNSPFTSKEKRIDDMDNTIKNLFDEKALKKNMQYDYSLRTVVGKPGRAICEVAEEESADMIIVGQRDVGKIRRIAEGCVCDYLLNHAHCSVTVCHHPHSVKKRRKFIVDKALGIKRFNVDKWILRKNESPSLNYTPKEYEENDNVIVESWQDEDDFIFSQFISSKESLLN